MIAIICSNMYFLLSKPVDSTTQYLNLLNSCSLPSVISFLISTAVSNYFWFLCSINSVFAYGQVVLPPGSALRVKHKAIQPAPGFTMVFLEEVLNAPSLMGWRIQLWLQVELYVHKSTLLKGIVGLPALSRSQDTAFSSTYLTDYQHTAAAPAAVAAACPARSGDLSLSV